MTYSSDRLSTYFREEWKSLLLIAFSGTVYNIGSMVAVWFEGQLVGRLSDVLSGKKTYRDMLFFVLLYLALILIVQVTRFMKRFYSRHFANSVSTRMKSVLYSNLLRERREKVQNEGEGNLLTKAISDTDDTAEGMRKFTGEIFDTGLLMASYAFLLFWYDWRIAALSLIFSPLSYLTAALMKKPVQKALGKYKKEASKLRNATLDISGNAVTYRIYGVEKTNREHYEKVLDDYEKTATQSNILLSSLPSLYSALSSFGIIFILFLGGRNVLGEGWKVWDIAAFTTFVSAFLKLSVKCRDAAKLFNSIEKASVSWKRIKPMLKNPPELEEIETKPVEDITITNLSVSFGNKVILSNINIKAKPGEIIGVTGPVAGGKSTFGKVFLNEFSYSGSVRYGEREISTMSEKEIASVFGYLGHESELFSDTIKNNILCGEDKDVTEYLKDVSIYDEVMAMEDGPDTPIGNAGVRLSGGQRERIALARTIAHPHPVLILDDPFSALDRTTEDEIFSFLKTYSKDRIIFLISHRLYNFPHLDNILFIDRAESYTGLHETLLSTLPQYRNLYLSQTGGKESE